VAEAVSLADLDEALVKSGFAEASRAAAAAGDDMARATAQIEVRGGGCVLCCVVLCCVV
jgi:hypothetical protein